MRGHWAGLPGWELISGFERDHWLGSSWKAASTLEPPKFREPCRHHFQQTREHSARLRGARSTRTPASTTFFFGAQFSRRNMSAGRPLARSCMGIKVHVARRLRSAALPSRKLEPAEPSRRRRARLQNQSTFCTAPEGRLLRDREPRFPNSPSRSRTTSAFRWASSSATCTRRSASSKTKLSPNRSTADFRTD